MTLIVIICLYLPIVAAEDNLKIDINTAPAEELMELKGIGPQKAARIIEFRETNGPFQTPDDFVKVPGIGPKTFEANKDRITVEVE
jgi:competence protein ComEA